MIKYIVNWYKEKFSDPHVVTLTLFILIAFALLYYVGNLLMPVIVAVVLAFLLESPVQRFSKIGLSRNKAVIIVMLLFTGIGLLTILGLLPVLWQQTSNLISEVPQMLVQGNTYLLTLPEQYPDLVKAEQIDTIISSVKDKLLVWGQVVLEASLNSISDLVALLIYLILVPLMVFFFLKDKVDMMQNAARFFPKERRLTTQVATEMHQQIHNLLQLQGIFFLKTVLSLSTTLTILIHWLCQHNIIFLISSIFN